MSRYAVLADIHGNIRALNAVLADAEKRGIYQFINLGDSFYGPMNAKATFDRLNEIEAIHILGNHDRELLGVLQMGTTEHPILSIQMEQLKSDQKLVKKWLESLETTTVVHWDLFACHANPLNDVDLFLDKIVDEELVQSDMNELESLLCCHHFPIYMYGHTHVPRKLTMTDGKVILNPGSVGVPAYTDTYPCYHKVSTRCVNARYAVVEKHGREWSAELIEVPYDHKAAAREASEKGFEDWAKWIGTGEA